MELIDFNNSKSRCRFYDPNYILVQTDILFRRCHLNFKMAEMTTV